MYKKFVWLVFVSVLLFSVLVGSPVMAKIVTGVRGDLELQMTVDNTTIVIGRKVNITLTLKNNGNGTITLGFPDAQVFDILLLYKHALVNVWSRDKLFAQVITYVELEPGETYSQTLKWNFYFWDGETYIAPFPGDYSLVGVIVNYWVMTSELPITLIDDPAAPIANFTYWPSRPVVNETITFNASSSLPGWNGTHTMPIVSYAWDFGDGNITTTSGPTAAHKFAVNGTYTVTLNVTDSQGLSNSMLKTITIHSPVHDVAIIGVSLFRTVVGFRIPTGFTEVYVIVENQGDFTETFNVTVYYQNATGEYSIGMQAATLAAGAKNTLTFIWYTKDLAKTVKYGVSPQVGYAVKAEASVVPSEEDTGDNTLVKLNALYVTIPGDIDADGFVYVKDLGSIGKAWKTYRGHPRYDPNADVNCDGIVDVKDLGYIGRFWRHKA